MNVTLASQTDNKAVKKMCMSACSATQPPRPWPSDVLPPEAYEPIKPESMKAFKSYLAKCVSNPDICKWVGTLNVRCMECQATWVDLRTRYNKAV